MVAKKTKAKKVVKTAAKSVVKKPVKKISAKRVSVKKSTPMQSFRVYKDDKPFVRLGVTRQTLYWTILLTFIIVTQLWILKIQLDIANLTALLAN